MLTDPVETQGGITIRTKSVQQQPSLSKVQLQQAHRRKQVTTKIPPIVVVEPFENFWTTENLMSSSVTKDFLINKSGVVSHQIFCKNKEGYSATKDLLVKFCSSITARGSSMRHQTATSNIDVSNVMAYTGLVSVPKSRTKVLNPWTVGNCANYCKCSNFVKVMTRRNTHKRAPPSRTNPIQPNKPSVISATSFNRPSVSFVEVVPSGNPNVPTIPDLW